MNIITSVMVFNLDSFEEYFLSSLFWIILKLVFLICS